MGIHHESAEERVATEASDRNRARQNGEEVERACPLFASALLQHDTRSISGLKPKRSPTGGFASEEKDCLSRQGLGFLSCLGPLM